MVTVNPQASSGTAVATCAAAADAIWAKLIVEYGTHWAEKRPFAEAPRYLDAILALEPTYPLVYKYAEGIYGRSDELGKTVAESAVSIPDFHATICAALGVDPARKLVDDFKRPVPITDGGAPIAALFS